MSVPEAAPGVITLKENHIGDIEVPVIGLPRGYKEVLAKTYKAALEYREYIKKHQPQMLFDVLHIQNGDHLLIFSVSPECNKKLKEVQL